MPAPCTDERRTAYRLDALFISAAVTRYKVQHTHFVFMRWEGFIGAVTVGTYIGSEGGLEAPLLVLNGAEKFLQNISGKESPGATKV